MGKQLPLFSARACAATVLTGGLLLAGVATATADEEEPPGESPAAPEGVNTEDFMFSPDADDFIVRYEAEHFIEYLGNAESEEENVVVLETDILFNSNEWDLPGSAGAQIGELVEEIPEGAAVNVHGHTDSRPVDETQYDFGNQELSENRAQAVADVLEEERPDLELTVKGFGDSEPAETEDEEDPSTFAANRRVEIRYGD